MHNLLQIKQPNSQFLTNNLPWVPDVACRLAGQVCMGSRRRAVGDADSQAVSKWLNAAGTGWAPATHQVRRRR